MNITFCINKLALEGLGSTLTSLTRHCSNTAELSLWFLCSGLGEKDKGNIKSLLKQEDFKGSIFFFDFNAKQIFGHLKSLHGDWTAYGKLLIPATIPEEVVLYLDADLVINNDILKLGEIRAAKPLTAVYGCDVQWALERIFFMQQLQWPASTGYFNSGVLLFNLQAWKEKNIDAKIKLIAQKYPAEFLSADQTLFNAALKDEVDWLPEVYNVPWYPGRKSPGRPGAVIYHFVGSPKPWDMFGRMVHYGYNTWKLYQTDFWKATYGKIGTDKIQRAWHVRKSFIKNLKTRLSGI